MNMLTMWTIEARTQNIQCPYSWKKINIEDNVSPEKDSIIKLYTILCISSKATLQYTKYSI